MNNSSQNRFLTTKIAAATNELPISQKSVHRIGVRLDFVNVLSSSLYWDIY